MYAIYSPFSGESFSSSQVIYSCGLGSPPHAIKKLFGCTRVAHWPSILPSLPLPFPFIFPAFAHWRGAFSLRHRWHPPFCQGRWGEVHKWLLSPVTPFSSQHRLSLWCADCANTMRAIAEGDVCSAAMLIIFSQSAKCLAKPLSECKWWFAKAVFLNDAFHGLSVISWWLGFNWSLLFLAIHSTILHMVQYGEHWLNARL